MAAAPVGRGQRWARWPSEPSVARGAAASGVQPPELRMRGVWFEQELVCKYRFKSGYMSKTRSTLCRRTGCSDSAGRSKNLNSLLITEHQHILQRNNLQSVSGWELCANSYFQNWLTLTFSKSIFNGACFSLQRWGGRYWWRYKCLAPSEKTSGK